MKIVVIVFFGLNCDCDMFYVLELIIGLCLVGVWYIEMILLDVDLVVVFGGFFYGDYLCLGVIVVCLLILVDLVIKVGVGVLVFGVCNGFQILIEVGFLLGVLMCNVGLIFVCKEVLLEIVNSVIWFFIKFVKGQVWCCLVVYYDGNYFVDIDILKVIEDNNQVVFCYVNGINLNGLFNDIVGIINVNGNVFGMMLYLENLVEFLQGGFDGCLLFESFLDKVV